MFTVCTQERRILISKAPTAMFPRPAVGPHSMMLSSMVLVSHITPQSVDAHGVLPIVAISYCWLTINHPDPDCEQLHAVARALQKQRTCRGLA